MRDRACVTILLTTNRKSYIGSQNKGFTYWFLRCSAVTHTTRVNCDKMAGETMTICEQELLQAFVRLVGISSNFLFFWKPWYNLGCLDQFSSPGYYSALAILAEIDAACRLLFCTKQQQWKKFFLKCKMVGLTVFFLLNAGLTCTIAKSPSNGWLICVYTGPRAYDIPKIGNMQV